MEFDVESANLKQFFTKIVPEEFQLKITKDGMKVQQLSGDQATYTDGILLPNAFIKYPEVTEDTIVPIVSKEELLKYIGRFEGKIKLKFEDKCIKFISEKRTARMSIGHSDIIAQIERPALSFEGSFKVNSKIFKEAIANSSLVGKEVYEMKVQDGAFSIKVSNQVNEIVETEKVEYADNQCSYAAGFNDVFSRVSGDVFISLKTGTSKKGYPLLVSYKDKMQTIDYIVAPFNETTNKVPDKKEENQDA